MMQICSTRRRAEDTSGRREDVGQSIGGGVRIRDSEDKDR